MDFVGVNASIMKLVVKGNVLILCLIRGIVEVATTSVKKEVLVPMECVVMLINII